MRVTLRWRWRWVGCKESTPTSLHLHHYPASPPTGWWGSGGGYNLDYESLPPSIQHHRDQPTTEGGTHNPLQPKDEERVRERCASDGMKGLGEGCVPPSPHRLVTVATLLPLLIYRRQTHYLSLPLGIRRDRTNTFLIFAYLGGMKHTRLDKARVL